METQNNSSLPTKKSPAGIISAVILGIAIIGLGAWRLLGGNTSTAPTQENTNENPEPNSATSSEPKQSSSTDQVPSDVSSNKKYKDGTYSVEGAYLSPAGPEKVGVSVTLKADVITAATLTPEAVNPTSKIMQQKFAAGFKEKVIGKSIDEVSLTVVNGSSFTPKGFMDALAKIKTEATIES